MKNIPKNTLEKNKLTYKNIFHFHLKPQNFIFKIKLGRFSFWGWMKHCFWNGFLRVVFHFSENETFLVWHQLIKNEWYRKINMQSKSRKMKCLCTLWKVMQRDIFPSGFEGRPWGGGGWSVTFCPRMFLLMNNFNLKKEALKCAHSKKWLIENTSNSWSIRKAIFESSQNLRFYTMYKKMCIILYILGKW